MAAVKPRDIRKGVFLLHWQEVGAFDTAPRVGMVTNQPGKSRTFVIVWLDDLSLEQLLVYGDYQTVKSDKARGYLESQERHRRETVAYARRQVLKAELELQRFRERRHELGLVLPRRTKGDRRRSARRRGK